MRGDRIGEQRARRGGVTSDRDVHVDDPAVAVDSAIHVPPHAGDVDVGLIDERASADGMAARSRRVDQQRCEPLHPVDDVIDFVSWLVCGTPRVSRTEPKDPGKRARAARGILGCR